MIFMNQVLTCICRYLYILNKKNSHENFLVFFKKPLFFYLLLACPTVNSGKFFRGQPLSPNVNHCVCQVFQTKVYWKPYNGVGSLSLTKHLGICTRYLLFRCQCLNNQLGHSSLNNMYLRLLRASIFAKCKNVWWSRPRFETQLKIEFLLSFTSSRKALKITIIYTAISDLPNYLSTN